MPQPNGNVYRGKVKMFSEDKSFGFIIGDDGVERFFHRSNLAFGGKRATIAKDTIVNFEPAIGTKGPKAINVRPAR